MLYNRAVTGQDSTHLPSPFPLPPSPCLPPNPCPPATQPRPADLGRGRPPDQRLSSRITCLCREHPLSTHDPRAQGGQGLLLILLPKHKNLCKFTTLYPQKAETTTYKSRLTKNNQQIIPNQRAVANKTRINPLPTNPANCFNLTS